MQLLIDGMTFNSHYPPTLSLSLSLLILPYRKRLRDHMAADKLPCIPYLGLFLTDLCFTYEIPSKRGQFDTVCNTIAYFQNSTYGT